MRSRRSRPAQRRLGRLGRVKHVKSTVEQAFAEMDKDESGSLDRSEIRSLLANPLLTHRILTDEEIDAIMLKIDPNEDGDVTKKEFAAFWESADADGLRQACALRPKTCLSTLLSRPWVPAGFSTCLVRSITTDRPYGDRCCQHSTATKIQKK